MSGSPVRLVAVRHLLLVAIPLLTAGCGDPIGSACQFTGSGFQASDNCRHRCLQYRPISCPGGQQINPHICSGRRDCTPGSCGTGELCYTVEDPFNLESYCVPADVCGALTPSTIAEFEAASQSKAERLRAAYTEKQRRRKTAKPTTAPDR